MKRIHVKGNTWALSGPQQVGLYQIDETTCLLFDPGSTKLRPGIEEVLAETGLTPVFDEAAPYFAEAKMVLICRKLHKQPIDPAGFIDPSIDATCYPEKDYHEMFVGSIEKVLVKE